MSGSVIVVVVGVVVVVVAGVVAVVVLCRRVLRLVRRFVVVVVVAVVARVGVDLVVVPVVTGAPPEGPALGTGIVIVESGAWTRAATLTTG
jgi:hypothetical protein